MSDPVQDDGATVAPPSEELVLAEPRVPAEPEQEQTESLVTAEVHSPSYTADPIDLIFDRWMLERIHDSPVSRYTEAYNYLVAALNDLRERLRAKP